jgi:hypothetical protein
MVRYLITGTCRDPNLAEARHFYSFSSVHDLHFHISLFPGIVIIILAHDGVL